MMSHSQDGQESKTGFDLVRLVKEQYNPNNN